MPNYVLSRTSPPTHIYERKINLGYGVKVDTSDAPTAEPNKGNKMNEQALELVDIKVNPVNGQPATIADSDVNGERIRKQVEAQAASEGQDGRGAVEGNAS